MDSEEWYRVGSLRRGLALVVVNTLYGDKALKWGNEVCTAWGLPRTHARCHVVLLSEARVNAVARVYAQNAKHITETLRGLDYKVMPKWAPLVNPSREDILSALAKVAKADWNHLDSFVFYYYGLAPDCHNIACPTRQLVTLAELLDAVGWQKVGVVHPRCVSMWVRPHRDALLSCRPEPCAANPRCSSWTRVPSSRPR